MMNEERARLALAELAAADAVTETSSPDVLALVEFNRLALPYLVELYYSPPGGHTLDLVARIKEIDW